MASNQTLSTLFDKVLDTNYAPSPGEMTIIRDLIDECEQEIWVLDQETQGSEYRARRNELIRFIKRHRMLLAPFRRLPNDMWGEVFVQCLLHDGPPRSVKDAPLLLTVICRSWRNIALRTPKLWTGIRISIPETSHFRDVGALRSLLNIRQDGLDLWLKRSGSLPLEISFSMEPRSIPFLDADSEPEAVQKACAGFTRTLAGFSTRWKSLSVHALPLWVIRPFESLEAKDLPLLERIYVTGTLIRQVHQTLRTPPALLPVIERSLALHTLHIEILHNFDFDLVSLIWGRLKVLHITFADPMNGVVVLQSLSRLCPSLEECSLDFLVSIDTVTSSPSPVEWPRLRELEFRPSAPNGRSLYNFDIYKMLESITTPALTSLRVDIWGTGYHDAPIELDLPFHNLIVRSRCELKSLVMLTDVGTTFSNTLHLLSSLTSLTLSMFADIPDYLTNPRTVFHYQMAMDALMALGEDLVCPRLTRLHFVACHPATASSFLDLVRTRVREQSVSLAIFKAAFTLSSEGDDQVLTSVLKEAKPEGLGVRFKWEFWMNRQHGSEKLILPEDGSEVRHYPAFAINSGQDSRTLS